MPKTLQELLQPLRDLRAAYPKDTKFDSDASRAFSRALHLRINAFYLQAPLQLDIEPRHLRYEVKNWLRYVGQQPRRTMADIRVDLELLRPDFLDSFWPCRLWVTGETAVIPEAYPTDCFAFMNRDECPGLEEIKVEDGRLYSELSSDPKLQNLSTATIAKRKAFLAKPELTHVTISVPSGVLLAADWFRIEQFTKAVRNHDEDALSINYYAGQAASTQHTAQHQVFSVHVGNSSPQLCMNADLPGILQGVDLYDEHDSLFDEEGEYLGLPENLQLKGRVCTDLWNTTIIDKKVLIDILCSSGYSPKKAEKAVADYLDNNEVAEIIVPPGVYHGYCFYGDNSPGLSDWTVDGKPLLPEIAQSYWLLSPTPLNLAPPPQRDIPVTYTTSDNRVITVGVLEVAGTGWCLRTPLDSIASTFMSDEPIPEKLDLSTASELVTDIINTCDSRGLNMTEHLAWLEMPAPRVTDSMLEDSLRDCTAAFERSAASNPGALPVNTP